MPHIQVKNVPDELHASLRRLASDRGCRIRDIVLAAVRNEIRRLEFEERLEARGAVELGEPAAHYLAEARDERGR